MPKYFFTMIKKGLSRIFITVKKSQKTFNFPNILMRGLTTLFSLLNDPEQISMLPTYFTADFISNDRNSGFYYTLLQSFNE